MRKGGGEILIEMSLNPVGLPGEENGRFVLAIIRDITERKRGDEALRDAEALFHSVFDNAPIRVAVVGLDGRFLRATVRCARSSATRRRRFWRRHSRRSRTRIISMPAQPSRAGRRMAISTDTRWRNATSGAQEGL